MNQKLFVLIKKFSVEKKNVSLHNKGVNFELV